MDSVQLCATLISGSWSPIWLVWFCLFLPFSGDGYFFFFGIFEPTDCCPGCTNVQTVSSPLHLNPYGIKVKGILSSDYSSNLLNNVLLPSFSAAAEIPPSLMIQPPSCTTVLTPLHLSLSLPLCLSIPAFSCIILFGPWAACFCINPHPSEKEKKKKIRKRQRRLNTNDLKWFKIKDTDNLDSSICIS